MTTENGSSKITDPVEADMRLSEVKRPKPVRSKKGSFKRKYQNPEYKERRQAVRHKDAFLWTVICLAVGSFILVVCVIYTLMAVRMTNSEYKGVSDIVVNILVAGVFGEVIGLMLVMVRPLWKPRDTQSTWEDQELAPQVSEEAYKQLIASETGNILS